MSIQYCIKSFIILLVFIIVLTTQSITYLFASISESEDISENIKAPLNVSQLIFSDVFFPFTHFKENQMSFTVTPIYFQINKVFHSESIPNGDINGDDLCGYGISLGYSYALSNTFYLSSSFIYNKMSGGMTGGFQSDNTNWKSNGTYHNLWLQFGMGYDIINSEIWSIPLYLGFIYNKYNINADVTPINGNNMLSYYNINADNYLYGVIFGISTSRKFELLGVGFKITPYILIAQYFNEISSTAKVTSLNSNYVGTNPDTVGDESYLSPKQKGFILPGLSISYLSQYNWSFSISISGIFSRRIELISDIVCDGMEMSTYSLTLSYNI